MNISRETVPSHVPNSQAKVESRRFRWNGYINALLAAEVSTLTRYCDRLFQWKARNDDQGYLFDKIEAGSKLFVAAAGALPDLSQAHHSRDAILINGTF